MPPAVSGNISQSNVTPQQNTTLLAIGNYSKTTVAAPVAVPSDHNQFAVTVDRTNLPNTAADVVVVRVDCSVDNGLTWSPDPDGRATWPWGPFPLKFTTAGGVLKNSDGTTAATSGVGCGMTAQAGQKLRVTITPLQPTINSAVKLATANGTVNASAIS